MITASLAPCRLAPILALSIALCLPGPTRAVPLPAASLPDLVERLLPGVVTVTVTHSPAEPGPHSEIPPEILRRFADPPPGNGPSAPPHQSLGSGFVIDRDGYIVTNSHVVAEAADIVVTLADATELAARLVGNDPLTDLALLKIEAKKPLAALVWGDSDKARIGETVMAIGNPFGFGGTVTAGILSARNRDIGAGPYDDFLQTDAPVNRGNSGGPLVNLTGEVIGINTAIFSPPGQGGGSVGIAFAIPAAAARAVIEQLRATGRVQRGMIGVDIQEVTEEIAEGIGLDHPSGALVTSVEGPAARAGIQPGDVILAYDGKEIGNFQHLPRLVAASPIATRVAVDLWRRNAPMTVMVTIAERPAEQRAAAHESARVAARVQLDNLGLEIAAISPDLREEYGLDDDEEGVVVTKVEDDSDAAEQGVRPGDIIRAVAMEEVSNPTQVSEKLAAARAAGESTVLLLVDEDGEMAFVDLPLDKAP